MLPESTGTTIEVPCTLEGLLAVTVTPALAISADVAGLAVKVTDPETIVRDCDFGTTFLAEVDLVEESEPPQPVTTSAAKSAENMTVAVLRRM
jgi:hypothetical protein